MLAHGSCSSLFERTGTKKLYVVKDGYLHAKMTYTVGADDQIVEFPEVTLVAV